jgi:hypothetical protein
MVEFRADLHIHSCCSDGFDTPMQILILAKQAGLSALSITDHDTIQAYTPELFSQAKSFSLELLMGVEISAELFGLTVHILAYDFLSTLQEFLNEVAKKRYERNQKILDKLKKKGISIEEKTLHSSGPSQIIGRPHIADAMVKMGVVSSTAEAFDQYLKDGASCYVPCGKFTPAEVITAVHQSNGLAVLAHPHFLKKGRFLREILQMPFDGIECYYGSFALERVAPWLQMAKERGWIATGGSDYHGAIRHFSMIGSSWVNEEVFRKLCRRYN